MSTNDLMYNPTGGSFSGKLPMKSVAKLTFLRSLEGLYRYTGEINLSAYYAVRGLPSKYIDIDSEWPIVMPAGTIVSVVNLKDAKAYKAEDKEAGILANGDMYVSVGVDGTKMKKNINFLYDKEVSGLLTIANGGVDVVDKYADVDGEVGILDPSTGDPVSSASTGHSRPANVPFGLVDKEVAGDMRYRFLNYDARKGSAGISVSLDGILTLPYVAFFGAKDAAKTTAIESVLATVNDRHAFVWLDVVDQAELDQVVRGGALKSDKNGKFTHFVSGTDNDSQKFATIKEIRNRVPYNLDEIIETFPGSAQKGTDTGGLESRIYDFIKKIVTKTCGAPTAFNKETIKSTFHTPLVPTVSAYTPAAPDGFVIGQVDVAYGLYK